MNKPIIRIHNAETGEIIDREMNDEELAQAKIEQLFRQEQLELAGQKAAEKAALLAKLGITADEAKLLLG
jgi:hypothetical protein